MRELVFGLFKKKEQPVMSKQLIGYLNEVDLVYMRAYTTKSTREISKYVDPAGMIKVSQRIYSMSTPYFGSNKFRNTEWTLQNRNGSVLEILKDVSYDKIRVAGSLRVDVAVGYKEIWSVDTANNNLILDIARIS